MEMPRGKATITFRAGSAPGSPLAIFGYDLSDAGAYLTRAHANRVDVPVEGQRVFVPWDCILLISFVPEEAA